MGGINESPRIASPSPSRSLRRPFALLAVVVPVVLGILLAFGKRWVCDDAFLSFRYAENLVDGLGLVFNAGERVEGYTNFLWTVWVALGLRLGIEAEVWSMTWGLVFYGGTIGLLGLCHLRIRRLSGAGGCALPVGALVAAVHGDWNIWATGGLETSCFTFLATLGLVLLVTGRTKAGGLVAAGLVMAAAALTRPDGVIFVALGILWLLWKGCPPRRAALAFGMAFLAVWVPFTVWRVEYYGDFFPNTYYAKSAYLAWYSQGWMYVRLYLAKYWALLAGVPLVGGALLCRMRGGVSAERLAGLNFAAEAVLAGAFALAYTFYVIRVGGGFMYARWLIPATPFLLILVDLGLSALPVGRVGLWPTAGGLLLILATAYMPHPLKDRRLICGIANEWLYYPPDYTAKVRRQGHTLRRYFAGLPVRVAFFGMEAQLVYYSRVAVAIESDAGLTDRLIARRPIRKRGRVGHEKKPTVEYLIDDRKVHFVFHPRLDEALRLDQKIPLSGVLFDGLAARILHWDPKLMAALRERGARFEDFAAFLDRLLAQVESMPREQLAEVYAKCQRFYFDHVDDPQREAVFRARLGQRALAGDEAE